MQVAAYRNTERSARYTAPATAEQRLASQVAFLERRKRELGAELTTMVKAREKEQRRFAYEREMAKAEMQRDRERFAEEIAEHERRLSIVLSAIDRRERHQPRAKEDFVPTLNRIAERICKALRVPVVDLLSAKQDRDTALARQAFCYWAYRRTGAGPVMIGKYLARDHSTVMHGRRAYAAKRFKAGRNLRVLA